MRSDERMHAGIAGATAAAAALVEEAKRSTCGTVSTARTRTNSLVQCAPPIRKKILGHEKCHMALN